MQRERERPVLDDVGLMRRIPIFTVLWELC